MHDLMDEINNHTESYEYSFESLETFDTEEAFQPHFKTYRGAFES
jgi:hypothetical protein